MVLAAEAEHGRRTLERLGEVRQRRDPDPAADEQRPRHVEPEAVAERAEDGDLVAGLERGERARARADRVDQERELAARREAERHRPRQHAARRLEHEELPGMPGSSPPRVDAQQRVRADRLDRRRRYERSRLGHALLERQRRLGQRLRDRLDRGARDRERRDARHARDDRGLADRVAVACGRSGPRAC